MPASRPAEDLERRIAELEAANQRLRDEAEGVAAANVNAAMQLVELGESRQRELLAKNVEIERALHAAEAASQHKSRFLANISHELRTPISGIVGMTELLLDSELGGAQREFVGSIATTAETFLDLINQLLDFAKIEAGRLELEAVQYDLWETIESVVQMLQLRCDRKGVELWFDLSPSVPRHVIGDPLRVRQVLTNLGGNAAKFTDHGHVAIRVDVRGEPPRLQVTIEDTGCGIDADAAGRLFEPFVQADASTTRRFGGTGLGLAISHSLVASMHGTLRFDSVAGQGTMFCVDLPLQLAPACNASSVHQGTPRLVVADGVGEQVQAMLQQHLPRLGCRLDASGGAQASFAIVECRTTAPSELVARRQSVPSHLPMVAVVPIGSSIGDEALAALGVVAVLRRPVRPTQLDAAVRACLGDDVGRASERPGPERWPQFPGMRVLVAEDTAINRNVVMAHLRRFGCEIEGVEDGLEAVAAAARSAFDLVLMDGQMPRLDGIGATAAIRAGEQAVGGGRRMPIIALTANAMPGDRDRCLQAGMDDHLTKPVRRDQLAALLARWYRPGPG